MTEKFRKIVKLEALLDPMNLMLLSKQFLEQNFVSEDKVFGYLVAVFDLSLIYMLFVTRDSFELQKNALLSHACYIVKQMRERIEVYRGNTSYLEDKVLKSKIVKSLIAKITDMSDVKKKVPFCLTIELTAQIQSLKNDCQEKLGEELTIDLDIPETMAQKFKAIDSLRDGTKFSAQMNKIKFTTLVDSDDAQISHLA